MAEITKEQIEEFLQFNIVPRGIAATTFCGRLAELALQALRQQEGILAAMRDELQIDENGDNNCGADPWEEWETGLCAGYRVAYNVLKKLLAASERDQRGDRQVGQPPGAVAPITGAAGSSPASPHQTAAGQAGRDDHTGAEEARRKVRERYSDARCVPVLPEGDYEVKAWTTYWDYSVLGSGPTEEAAWVDAARRL